MVWKKVDNIKGPQGERGPAGTVSSVSIAALAPGSPATASISGSKDVHLHLEVPQGVPGQDGAEGPRGQIGPRGLPGADGTSVAILGALDTAADLPATGARGDGWLIGGDLYVWAENTSSWVNVGPIQGPKGDPGDTGPAGTIADVTAIGIAPGSSPTVTLGGTPSERTIQLGIPAGAKGDKGDDGAPYVPVDTGWLAVTLAAGWTGTVEMRRKGDSVRARGDARKDDFSGAYTTLVAELPAGIPAPDANAVAVYVPGSGSTPAVANIRATSDGRIEVRRTATSTLTIDFSGLAYFAN